MRAALALIFAGALVAVDLPDKALVDYWHAIAAHHAQNAAFQTSLTSEQKRLQEVLVDIDKKIEEARRKLAEACGVDSTLDETGQVPACKPKK